MSKQKLNRREFIRNASIGALGASVLSGINPIYASESSRAGGTGYIYDPRMLDHIISSGHVESPDRIRKMNKNFEDTGLIQELKKLPLLDDPFPYVKKVHTDRHIAAIQRIPKTNIAAEVAAASALGAAKAVGEGTVQNAFCAIRPPGHHAHSKGKEEGFCYYNNVAIATKYVQDVFGIKRVLIIDWDFHHGNGTQDTFYRDGSVLFFSTHNWRAYPNTGNPSLTGEGEGKGLNINFHMATGHGDNEMKKAWDEKLIPKVETFKPEFVFISAGFDSRINDRLGDLRVTDPCFAHITRLALQIAKTYSNDRLVSMLEGGYNVNGTVSAATVHVGELVDGATDIGWGKPRDISSQAFIQGSVVHIPFTNRKIRRITITNAKGTIIKNIFPSAVINGKLDLTKVGLSAGAYTISIHRAKQRAESIPCILTR